MTQLGMFEPTGAEVLALAQKHEREALRAADLAAIYDVRGWSAIASTLRKQAHESEQQAAQLFMLAEFEALGGVV